MASMTMAAAASASLLPTNLTKNPGKRGLTVVAKASSRATEGEKISMEMKNKEESSNGRRELVFAAAAAAACSIAKVAMADEPKPGTPEAKKKYAPICVTMPTAKICRK
ncbi:photosystem II 5 kDa protein, chloroplastic-like [Melia azedarach]|uniref:Photosystem II 5 kDa protein, chloroplastic-like n=1 Tax=Melia azedarach TaxID=155640 RepID=A0ACC1YNU4_MELAZ|nr:photosystem II 5 kDa protein, chloroplastic-like [Melia azedarach]